MFRSGSICASLLYKYLTTTDDTVDKSDEYQKNLVKVSVLAETFSSYGGILSKISQMINYAYGIHNTAVYSDCKPINEKKTKEFLESELLEFDDDLSSYSKEIYKSGSVGQVHRAVHRDQREIIIKVQYVGLKEIFDSDTFILDSIAKYLFTDANIKDAMSDIRVQLYEELDYTIEAKNQMYMKEVWDKEGVDIKIPSIVPELCNSKILTMEYISDTESLNHFLDSSSKEDIKVIGDLIIRFMFVNLFKYGLIYTDVHYGNFLIKDKKILYVLDFGSIHYIDKRINSYLGCLMNSIYIEDKDQFYYIMETLGVIPKKGISPESRDYMWEYFQLQFRPWTTTETFEFSNDFVDECGLRNVALMNEWVLPAKMIWLNKLCHGFTHIIGKMNFKGNYLDLFRELGVYTK
jgi:predicted unusual protein kinase regulating ubiquinone biosynthesis (AarF/ABC1/UbiB family)